MKITLTYLVLDEENPKIINFSPEEYYEHLEPGENYWDNGVEIKPFREEYLPVDPSKVKWFIITEKNDDMARITRYQLFNGKNSVSIHTIDEFNNEELIIQSLIAPETWHTIRSIKPHDGVWSTYVLHIDSDVKVNGKYLSENIIKNWGFEECKNFSYVQAKSL